MNPWTDAERHARRAHRHYEAGDWRLALAELKLAIEKDPHQAEWYVGLGLTLEALTRFGEAADAFRMVTSLRADDKDAWTHLGVNELRRNRPGPALEALNQATSIDRNAAAPYSHRILAHAMLEEHDQAEMQFYFALELADTPCPIAHDHMGHSLAMQGRYAEAAKCWQSCIQIDPTYPDAQACLARALWRDGQLEAATDAFRRHLVIENEDIDAMLDLARLERAKGQHRTAMDQVRRVSDLDPGSDAAWHLLGDLLAEQNKATKALEAYENALILNPDRPGVRLGLAQLYAKDQAPDNALALLQDELTCEGQSPQEMLAIADLLYTCHAPGRAASLLASLLEDAIEPLDDQLLLGCHMLRAKCMAACKMHEATIADLRQATKLEPTHAEAWARLAEAYVHNKRYQRAAAALRRAQGLMGDDEALLKQLNRHIQKHRLLERIRAGQKTNKQAAKAKAAHLPAGPMAPSQGLPNGPTAQGINGTTGDHNPSHKNSASA